MEDISYALAGLSYFFNDLTRCMDEHFWKWGQQKVIPSKNLELPNKYTTKHNTQAVGISIPR